MVPPVYSIPYNMLRVAIALEPQLRNLAKLNGLNVPLVCKSNSNWSPDIPFAWNDEIPISP